MLNSDTLPDTSFYSFMKQVVLYFLISCVFRIPYTVSKSYKTEKRKNVKTICFSIPRLLYSMKVTFWMLSPYATITFQIQICVYVLMYLRAQKNHCSLIKMKLWKIGGAAPASYQSLILKLNSLCKYDCQVSLQAHYSDFCFPQNTITCSTSSYTPFISNTTQCLLQCLEPLARSGTQVAFISGWKPHNLTGLFSDQFWPHTMVTIQNITDTSEE
jgi:hypothetical protein